MKTEYHADFLESAINCCLAGRRKGLPALMLSRFDQSTVIFFRKLSVSS